MKTIKELINRHKIRKLENLYYETLDDKVKELLDKSLVEYEEKYGKTYFAD